MKKKVVFLKTEFTGNCCIRLIAMKKTVAKFITPLYFDFADLFT